MISGRYQSQIANNFYEARVSAIGPGGTHYVSCDKFSVAGSSKTYLGSFVAELPTPQGNAIVGNVIRTNNFAGMSQGVSISASNRNDAGTIKLTIKYGQGHGSILELIKVSDSLRTLKVIYDKEDNLSVDGPVGSFVAFGKVDGTYTLPGVFKEALIDLQIEVSTQDSVTEKRGADLVWEMSELANAYRERRDDLIPYYPWAIWLFEVKKFNVDGVYGTIIKDLTDLNDQRRGCAVFSAPLEGKPLSDRARNRLRTITHEIGHCFNLIHTDHRMTIQDTSPCFMIPGGNINNDYWNNFNFKFNNDSLMDLHHGFFSEVCPGQSPFRDVDHYSIKKSRMVDLVAQVDEEATIGEPVLLKLTAINKSKKTLLLSNSLAPQWNKCRISIDGPDGKHYVEPLFLYCGTPKKASLSPGDSINEYIWLHANAKKIFFSRSGIYRIDVTWQIEKGKTIQAKTCTVKVREPLSELDQLVAERFQTVAVREFFELMGSDAPTLLPTQSLLEEITERWSDNSIAQKCSVVLAKNANRHFKSFSKKGLKIRGAKPEVAARELAKVLASTNKSNNIEDIANSFFKNTSLEEQEFIKAELKSKWRNK